MSGLIVDILRQLVAMDTRNPPPDFSKILKRIEEDQSLGKITTKKEAIELANEIASKK